MQIQTKKTDIVQWINKSLPNTQITKIEQLGNGSHYCLLMNQFCPNIIPIVKINVKARNQVDNIQNFKQLQQSFSRVGVKKILDIDRLSRHSFHENQELAAFLMTYLEANKDKLQIFKFNDKISPLANLKTNKENCPNSNQVQTQFNQQQQQIDEYQQMQLQKNQLRQILSDRDCDNANKINQIDQLFGFMLSNNQQEQNVCQIQNQIPEQVFVGISHIDNIDQNQAQVEGLAEEFDLTAFELLPAQNETYPDHDQKSQFQYEFQASNSKPQTGTNIKSNPVCSGHFQLVDEQEEEHLLMSKAGSQCKSVLGYTFSKEDQNLQQQQQSIQTPQHLSVHSMASSQRKILNLQHESQNKPQHHFSASPQFSQPQLRYQKDQNLQPVGSCSFEQQFSSEIIYQMSSSKNTDFASKEQRRGVQSVPVSKIKQLEDQMGNISVGKQNPQNQICVSYSGGGKMVEE